MSDARSSVVSPHVNSTASRTSSNFLFPSDGCMSRAATNTSSFLRHRKPSKADVGPYVQRERWAIFLLHVFDVSSKFLPQFSKPRASMMRSLCAVTCRQFDPAVMTTGNNCAIKVSHCWAEGGLRHAPVFLRGFWSAALKGMLL